MNKIILVLFCGLVYTAAVSLQSDANKALQKFAEIPFAQTMLGLIELNQDSGAPLQELLQLLSEIRSHISELNEVQDKEWSTQKRRCEVDNGRLQTTFNSAKNDLSNYKNEQDTLNKELSDVNSRLSEGQYYQKKLQNKDTQAYDRNRVTTATSEQRYEQENASFDRKSADYAQAIAACKEAQRLLMNTWNTGASFVQLSVDAQQSIIQVHKDLISVKELLELHAQKNSVNLFQPVLDALMELTSQKVNMQALNDSLSLIAKLIQALQEGTENLVTNHNTQIANLENLLDDLDKEKSSLQNAITNGNNRITDIQSRLNQLDGLISVGNQIFESTGQSLRTGQTSCLSQQSTQREQEVSRQQETDIVERLIELVRERLAAVSA